MGAKRRERIRLAVRTAICSRRPAGDVFLHRHRAAVDAEADRSSAVMPSARSMAPMVARWCPSLARDREAAPYPASTAAIDPRPQRSTAVGLAYLRPRGIGATEGVFQMCSMLAYPYCCDH